MVTLRADQNALTRAFILDCQDCAAARGLTVLHSETPMVTASATMEPRRPTRAFLAESRNTTGADNVMIYRDDEPAMTIPASVVKGLPRAWLTQGRVVRMTPRALARFQSFPDTYWLPDRAQLACTVIGNAVPLLLMQRVMESL